MSPGRVLALKIDVDTLRGTREGVPQLISILKKYQAQATFLFSLGPDNTGRALKRIFRPGFLKKVFRTNVAGNYGLKTLMYGVLIPGPDIGKHAPGPMRAARDAGFEVGIHTWDHIRWQDYVAKRDAEWTRHDFEAAVSRFREVFGSEPRTFGAAGWQMNAHAFELEAQHHMDYASDTRGSHPFMPEMHGRVYAVPQIPTTLPTLDELVGVGGVTVDNVAEHLLKLTAGTAPDHGHVFTLHAELEGMALMSVFERLLAGWQQQGYKFVATRDIATKLDRKSLPINTVIMAEVPGRSGTLALQGSACEVLKV